MATFLATLVFFGVIIAAMAVGVIFSGRALRGSCGGTGSDCSCSPAKREKCRSKETVPHAERPIDPSRLARSDSAPN